MRLSRRVAILNGFGRSLGDGIVGLQALSVALAEGAIPRNPVLYRLPHLPPLQRQLYALAPFCTVRPLPWSHASPRPRFRVPRAFAPIDLRDFAFDPAFRGQAMIDFFLGRLGVDPAAVAPSRRRNAWLAPLLPTIPGQDYVLLCPRASMALRHMPPEIQAALHTRLVARGRRVLRQAPMPTLRALCAQVAGAALVVSTDTATVHLADALGVPCLAFFTTHRPDWRVRDYPLCRAVHLKAALPPALEFPRGGADLEAARAAWFPHGADLSWLDAVLEES
jgi:hypothetical protein